MKTFTKNYDRTSKLFPKNLILWRGITINAHNGALLIDNCPFEQTERKSWVAKIQLNGQWILGPTIVPKDSRGITVFLMDKPPENWTHLLVTGTSKGLDAGHKGGAVFAAAAKPYSNGEYIKFRLEMFNWLREYLNAPFKEKILASKLLHPIESRPGQIKMVADYQLPGVLNYEHLMESENGLQVLDEQKKEGRPTDQNLDSRGMPVT